MFEVDLELLKEIVFQHTNIEKGHMNRMDKAKRDLYLKQVNLLKTFLSTGAISQAQYDKSFTCMTEKMGMEGVSLEGIYEEDEKMPNERHHLSENAAWLGVSGSCD